MWASGLRILPFGLPEVEPPTPLATKHLLILTHAYPPVPRLLKLAEYLPGCGWQVNFLAPRNPEKHDLRFSGAIDRAKAEVVETPLLRTPVEWLRRFQRAGSTAGVGDPGLQSLGSPDSRLSFITGWLRLLLLWASTPDDLAGWIPFALWAGPRIVRRHRPTVVLASGPPFSVVWAGGLLKRLTSVPLIVDFRDAWTLDPVDPLGCMDGSFRAPTSPRRRALLARLERRILETADHVLFTSDTTLRAYQARYPGMHNGQVVYNGVDEEDFDVSADETERSVLTYVGTLHYFQLEQVRLVIRALGSEGGLRLPPVTLRLTGNRPRALDEELRLTATAAGVLDRLVLEAPVPHRRAVSLLKSRGVQLLFAGESHFTRLSKISDCLATGRPILALAAANSETARHVSDHGHTVYSGTSPAELAGLLARLCALPAATEAPPDSFPFPYPHALHWRTLAASVAEVATRLLQR